MLAVGHLPAVGQGEDLRALVTPDKTENKHSIKYQFMADPLFYLFGFSYFAYVELATYLIVCSNPNRTSAQQ